MIRGLLTVVAVILVAALAFLGGSAVGLLRDPEIIEVETESTRSEIVTAVERQEQIVLLSTSTQGLYEAGSRTTALGWDIPGTGRTTFLQYNYRAKLGIEGGDVIITSRGEDRYLITVPEFTFIGHDDVEFETVLEDGGIISFVTPEIDQAQIITEILRPEAQAQHIEDNEDLLREQAENFYAGIIHSITADVELEFRFR